MKKILLALIIVLTGSMCYAQVAFKEGDKYSRKLSVNTNTVLTQGKRSININTRSSVSRSYIVDEIAGNIYLFNILTSNITDTVKTAKEQINYTSDKAMDANSFIGKSLDGIKNKQMSALVGENGVLVASSRNYLANKNDSLLAFSGLLPDQLFAGNTIDLIVNIPNGYPLKPGLTWASTITTVYGKREIAYTILSTNNVTSIIGFEGTEDRSYDNKQKAMPITCYFTTNISGKMKVDNKSLVVLERYTKTATSGYQSINRVIFTVAKRSSIAEVTK